MIPDFPGLGPIDWKNAANFTAAASSATHKTPTIEEMLDWIKKFAPTPLMLPKSLLEIPVDFNPCNYASAKAASELYAAHIKQDILGAFSTVPSSFLFPLFDVPLPPEPPPRRQLAHDDTHLFTRPEAKTRGQQFDEQEILRTAGKNRCQYAWSEVLQAHVRVGGPLR